MFKFSNHYLSFMYVDHTDVMCHLFQVNLATMEMYSPDRGKLRRTHYDGLFVNFSMSDTDYSIHAKIGHMQASDIVHMS